MNAEVKAIRDLLKSRSVPHFCVRRFNSLGLTIMPTGYFADEAREWASRIAATLEIHGYDVEQRDDMVRVIRFQQEAEGK